MRDRWETAILEAEEARGGARRDVSNREIYDDIGRFIDLSSENLRETQYGGRQAYEHAVRKLGIFRDFTGKM